MTGTWPPSVPLKPGVGYPELGVGTSIDDALGLLGEVCGQLEQVEGRLAHPLRAMHQVHQLALDVLHEVDHLADDLPGDVLIRIDGKVVKNARSAMSRIAQSGPGTKLQLEGIRDGKTFRTTAVTGHRPES